MKYVYDPFLTQARSRILDKNLACSSPLYVLWFLDSTGATASMPVSPLPSLPPFTTRLFYVHRHPHILYLMWSSSYSEVES